MTTEEKKECWLCRRPLTDIEFEEAKCPDSTGCGKHICDQHNGDTFMRYGHDPAEHIDDNDEFQL